MLAKFTDVSCLNHRPIKRRRERVASFWYGERLTRLHWECIDSFLLRGFDFDLYSFDQNLVAPPGCRLRDAADILPISDVVFYKNVEGPSAVALFANYFRYAMLHRDGGWWVDTDVFQLRNELPTGERCFFAANESNISNAIIRTPKNASIMEACYRKGVEMGKDVRWGRTGPRLVTKLVQEMGYDADVAPASAYNPLPWTRALAVTRPNKTREVEALTTNSFGIHLWSAALRRKGVDLDALPQEGSFLHRLYASNARLRRTHGAAEASFPH